MSLEIIQVDAFTNRPFSGNPAGVCLLPEAAEAEWMQNVAAEMNLSETAFLYPQDDGFNLRWFTPATEVELCGHATLASAHVLWERKHLASDATARFHTLSGLLTAVRQGTWIEMDFPAEPVEATAAPDALIEALGVEPTWIGQNRMDYLVEVATEAKVRELQPNFSLLKQVPCRGIIVTSQADSGDYDFTSRFFAPKAGIDEDPVTGSAHCALGPYWADRLGQDTLVGYQASRRGGVVRTRLNGERVLLDGQAVTVLRCEWVPPTLPVSR